MPRQKKLSYEQIQELRTEALECLAKYEAEKAANPNLPALAPHEIYEIYGSPMLQLHPPERIK